MKKTEYTPKLISDNNENPSFSIPLYQRLFEWEELHINLLLNDLWNSFEKDSNKPYYIGMLTVFKRSKNQFDLVDGQQRFTVLMLMGIAFKNETWKKFLLIDEKPRLHFFARKNDSTYLENKIFNKGVNDYKNKKMEDGIFQIEHFLERITDKENFANYIFEKATFFLNVLPEEYDNTDLNRYFESMNSSGKGLEKHEILKVELLKKLPKNPIEQNSFIKIWNIVSDMNKSVIRQKEGEKNDDFLKIQIKSLQSNDDIINFVLQRFDKNDNSIEFPKIIDIQSTQKAPSIRISATGERSIISFSEFLLLVLSLQMGDKLNIPDLFNVHKLLESFKKLEDTEVLLFFKNLLKFRLLFDYFIIKVNSNEPNSISYSINMNDIGQDYSQKKHLIQYQSMLYVSTSFHIWIPNIMQFVDKNREINVNELLLKIKEFDNSRLTKPEEGSLVYGKIERYWFWRLDYYLWEGFQNSPNFLEHIFGNKIDKNCIEAIKNYTFRPNRSIEHLYPQSFQKKDSWDEDLNSFGNLAMISSSFNSTQSNDDTNVKFARIENQITGKYGLESIKLLLMYLKAKDNKEGWTKIISVSHGQEMFKILIDSF